MDAVGTRNIALRLTFTDRTALQIDQLAEIFSSLDRLGKLGYVVAAGGPAPSVRETWDPASGSARRVVLDDVPSVLAVRRMRFGSDPVFDLVIQLLEGVAATVAADFIYRLIRSAFAPRDTTSNNDAPSPRSDSRLPHDVRVPVEASGEATVTVLVKSGLTSIEVIADPPAERTRRKRSKA